MAISRIKAFEPRSGEAGAGGEEGVEGDVVEEGEFEAEGYGLAEVGGEAAVIAAGAEFGEGFVAGAGEFDSGGEDGGVEVEDGEELDLDAELHIGGGEGFAVEDPAAAVGEGGGERGKQAVALLIGEGLDVEGFQFDLPPGLFIGRMRAGSEGVVGTGVM